MQNKNNAIKSRVLEEARYLIDNHATVRATAKQCGTSKSTVHKDIVERLNDISPLLYEEAMNVISANKAERAHRGGMATRRVYLLKKQQG